MLVTVIHRAVLEKKLIDAIMEKIPGELEHRGDYFQLHHSRPVSIEALTELRRDWAMDINTLPSQFAPDGVRLLISDMDSTFINIECVDEIADFAGVKPQVHAITEAAMRGELNFEGSLVQRVKLLTGLDAEVLQKVYDERLLLNPGGEQMLKCLKSHNIKFALVSGGFTFFTDQLKTRYGLDYTRANVLEINDGHLCGRVMGDIVGADSKASYLLELCKELDIELSQTVAIGDGANDLKMMKLSGLSIAFHAKAKVQAQADVVLNYVGLEGVCHLLNIPTHS